MDDQFDKLLSLGFCKSPSQSLESRTYPDFFGRFDQIALDLLILEGSQFFLHLHELLSRVDWIQRRHRHLTLESLRAETVDALHAGRRMDTFHWVESILELSLNWLNLLFK